MDGFEKLSYDEVGSIANELSANSETMKNILDSISDQLNKIGSDGVWSGDAASAAAEEFNTLKAKFPEFNEAVKSCSDYLINMVKNYVEADNAVSGR